VAPHVARALSLHRQLAVAAARADGLTAVLDCFATAVLLLDARGRLLQTNQRAAHVLSAPDGLLASGGRLSCRAAGDASRLEMLVARAIPRTGEPRREAGFMAVARGHGRRPLGVFVAPLTTAGLALDCDAAAAVIFAFDPEERLPGPAEVVRDCLGLTLGEARLAVVLARGADVTAAAGELGISIHTARTHLKRALAKTDARRQSDLVRLVLATPASLACSAAVSSPGPLPSRTPSGG
jgi:DNA-binding CsgD family transcriptional regulator